MYYINNFLLYSLLGFIMESTLFKITNTLKFSGIFYGPITAVYGFGVLAIMLLNKYIFKNIKINKYLKILLEYIVLTIILSLIELIVGYTTNIIFNVDMWDYSEYYLHLGKYVCLRNSLIWGLLGVLYIYVFQKFTNKILSIINKKENIIFLCVFLIDTILVILTKI